MSVFGWLWARRGWFAVVVPYLALFATVVVALGVLDAKADANELRTQQAKIAAELAAEHAMEAQEETAELEREAARSCQDRQQARSDLDEVLRLMTSAIPPRIAVAINAKLAEREPIEC